MTGICIHKSERVTAENREILSNTVRQLVTLLSLLAAGFMVGCASGNPEKEKDAFFTSGSREADQRASQRMARDEQLKGTGEGTGEENVKKATENGDAKGARTEGKLTLFERLGGQEGIAAIIEDFVPRVLNDPRVNWQRSGVSAGGWFRRDRSVEWTPTPGNVDQLKLHLVQFLSLATGGPSKYSGKDMRATHADMEITNPEFDAAVGDLKATLDRRQVPNQEQKELLAIIESTRPQVVTVR